MKLAKFSCGENFWLCSNDFVLVLILIGIIVGMINLIILDMTVISNYVLSSFC